MKKIKLLMFCTVAAFMFFAACGKEEGGDVNPADTTPVVPDVPDVVEDNIYQFKVLDGNGDSVSLKDYKDQVLLVVNTATQCGYTPQYTQLQQIYETYKDQGFVVLDFPCNQFGGQAPGSYDDIHDFCTSRYGITFPQFAKIDVNGNNASPLYVWLKEKKPGAIRWNFTKFLIDRQGNVVRRFEPENAMSTVEAAVRKLVEEQ